MSKPHVTNSITPAVGLSVFLARLMRGENLSRSDASAFLEALLNEESTDGQIAAALVALAAKGETVDELTGIAAAMRSRAVPLKPRHERFLDTAGTGSSCAKTFNVSTAAAFVIAGAATIVLGLGWSLYATDRPAQHKSANDAERALSQPLSQIRW